MQKKYIAVFAAAALLNTEIIAEEETIKTDKSITATSAIKQSTENNITQKDKVLAEINGQKIMLSDFDKSFNTLSISQQASKVKYVISSEILVQYASKDKLWTDEAFEKEVDKYGAKLKSQGKRFTPTDKRMVKGLTIVNKLAKKAADQNITDATVKTYYEENKEKFKGLDYVEAYEIVTTSEKEAKTIIINLDKDKNIEKTFIDLAKKSSSIGHKNGDLNRVYKFGVLNGPIKRTLFKLEKGSYSTIPTAFNNEYYIFYLKNKGKDDQIP